jgi:hypothetical protein
MVGFICGSAKPDASLAPAADEGVQLLEGNRSLGMSVKLGVTPQSLCDAVVLV